MSGKTYFSTIIFCFLRGTVTSVLKRGKDPNGYDSYRSIAVACNISKVF